MSKDKFNLEKVNTITNPVLHRYRQIRSDQRTILNALIIERQRLQARIADDQKTIREITDAIEDVQQYSRIDDAE